MVAHSDGETTWSTKLERIATLAASNKELRFNNLGHVICLEMLCDMYQELDGRKAIGIDGVSKEAYGKQLEQNLKEVLHRIRKGTYKPKAAKLVEIPKEDGSFRPLAISCFEDKIVQMAVNKILCAIYEPLFLRCSYGFRPDKNCHEALRALKEHTYQNKDGAIVEIDIRKCFNAIPHQELNECFSYRISDNRFLRLINVLLKTPTWVNGQIQENVRGCPQGSICSPTWSNIYLHYVIDVWFKQIGETHIKGKTAEIRFADDMVFVFENKKEAERFYEVLPKRLNKFGLEMHQGKSQLIESGKVAAARANSKGLRLQTYKFLGFTCYWGLARAGFWRIKFASRSDRFTAKLKGLRQYLKDNSNCKTHPMLLAVKRVVQGWINYHAISDNEGRVWMFVYRSRYAIFNWLNRRGGKRRMNWKRFMQILNAINFPVKWKTTSMFTSVVKQT